MDGEQDGTPDVGSVAEEAVKLLGALSGWASDLGGGVAHGLDEHLDTGAPECRWCPVCRTVHAVRGMSPEVRAQLATAGTALLDAAAALLATAVADQQTRTGVEHIDLDDGDDGSAWPEETTEEREP